MNYVFEGTRREAQSFLKSAAGRYYIYLLCRPSGEPFYIGKGLNLRALEHEAEARRGHPVGETNPFKCNVIRKILRDGEEVLYRIESLYEAEYQQVCLIREAELISQYKRLHEGGCLTNLAGGIGSMAGSTPYSLERHAATLSGAPEGNPERATLNRFLLSIGPVASIPVKPINQIARILPSTPHPSPRSPTLRCAYALIASASAEGLPLVEGVEVSRSFTYEGVKGVMENGVSRDLLKAGMASLVQSDDPANERYRLSSAQIALISDLVGHQHLAERGLI